MRVGTNICSFKVIVFECQNESLSALGVATWLWLYEGHDRLIPPLFIPVIGSAFKLFSDAVRGDARC